MGSSRKAGEFRAAAEKVADQVTGAVKSAGTLVQLALAAGIVALVFSAIALVVASRRPAHG